MSSNTRKGRIKLIVDALSRRYVMLSQLDCHIFGLETIKEQYANDVEFRDVTEHCKEGHH
jgi:hypothetical protein